MPKDKGRHKALMDEERVYGGGLHKLEPRELGDAVGEIILKILSKRSMVEL